MINYILTMAKAKMGEKGALFVEYALILAFVIVVGAVLVGSGENAGIKGAVSSILGSTKTLVSGAAQ